MITTPIKLPSSSRKLNPHELLRTGDIVMSCVPDQEDTILLIVRGHLVDVAVRDLDGQPVVYRI